MKLGSLNAIKYEIELGVSRKSRQRTSGKKEKAEIRKVVEGHIPVQNEN